MTAVEASGILSAVIWRTTWRNTFDFQLNVGSDKRKWERECDSNCWTYSYSILGKHSLCFYKQTGTVMCYYVSNSSIKDKYFLSVFEKLEQEYQQWILMFWKTKYPEKYPEKYAVGIFSPAFLSSSYICKEMSMWCHLQLAAISAICFQMPPWQHLHSSVTLTKRQSEIITRIMPSA